MSVGAEAEFRCRHETADTIRWRVNGSLVRRSEPPPGVSSSTINNVDMLTVIARVEYNNTEVVCVAQFDSGVADEESTIAILRGRF